MEDPVLAGFSHHVSASVREHLIKRKELISQEKKHRSDAEFRRTLSPTARKACEIVHHIRAEEQQRLWRHTGTQGDHDAELFPGMMFSLAKERMESTNLWRICRRLPKGALLHSHLPAMVDLGWLFNVALDTPGMQFYASQPLTSDTACQAASVFFGFSKASTKPGLSIWTPEYSPNTLIPAAVAAETFPKDGRAGFITWLKDRCSIVEKEAIEHHLGVDAIWRKMQGAFPIIHSIIYYEPILRKLIRKLLQTLAEDGVQWVEIRDAFACPYRKANSDTTEDDFCSMIGVIAEEIESFKASEEGRDFWGARIIWTALRFNSAEAILRSMQNCIRAKKQYPDLIAGFDLVGQEDLGKTLKELSYEILWFRQKCVEEELEVPFLFHAGECLGDGDSTDENLFDAILFGTRRLGHGFSLFKHPDLIEIVKEKRILIESCPISNEVLRLTSTVLAHPLPALLARGISASLSNDDPALLGQGTSGMTHDFWEALQSWENLGLAGLGCLAENSVRWAVHEDQTEADWVKDIDNGYGGNGIRADRMKKWKASWEEFCQWVVDEFGKMESN
ncbi:CECR1 family adenosine deaminase [Coccidioides immitis RS]|uniref:adenosine deaminase n=2 Tax=Coccidioides immitis TaxID=5501 RepID=J3KD93_COCIM|nr:CECR1 family adenosine deaminase [Coccidioides immitis RS]EAS33306.3 CECR1 family adenosine deaminase [Coccidioides immitis RS]KMP04461.1 salivary adenosine deaminase [Coccidioides immitis RMSCC 2394]